MFSVPSISSITKINSKSPARLISRSSTGQVKQSRSTQRINSQSIIGYASALCLVLSIFGLGYYITATNASVKTGYDMKKQQLAIEELKQINKRLMVEQASMGSIVKVNDVASASNMVPVTGEEYLVANQLSSR